MTRRWLELRVRDRAAAEPSPLLVEGVLALGARAAEEIDGWYVTAVEEPDDRDAFVARMAAMLRELTGSDGIEIRTEWRGHEDWAETWRRGLAPRRITDRVVVRPSWFPPSSAERRALEQPAGGAAGRPAVEIVIDPGMAFGTAEHGTTRGCLRLLDRTLKPGDRVLDVGSGSGILAIAAALLGAADVVALEADALACEALRENLERNEVTDRVRCVERMVSADELARMGPVSGVVANIESGPLATLMDGFAGAVEAGGWLILSGILDTEWATMCARAGAAGFRLRETDAEDEWRSGAFVRDR
ncbi:MAG: 50S ribosomal protein L11 methyltransferase [Gemmatimonadales bacterium]